MALNNRLSPIAYVLLLSSLFFVGCTTPKPDPLAGWKPIGNISYQLDPKHNFPGSVPCNQAILDDMQNFIQTFPPNERGYNMGPFQLYEDGMGQHAVSFEVFVGAYTSWHYALFYDKQNKRIRVVKYGRSRYVS